MVLHRALEEVEGRSTYRGVLVGCLAEEGSKTRAGAEQTKKVSMLDLEKVVDSHQAGRLRGVLPV